MINVRELCIDTEEFSFLLLQRQAGGSSQLLAGEDFTSLKKPSIALN